MLMMMMMMLMMMMMSTSNSVGIWQKASLQPPTAGRQYIHGRGTWLHAVLAHGR